MTNTSKRTPCASWLYLLAFLVALGLVPGVPGFEHVRDALLLSTERGADARPADPESWPVTTDLVPAVVAPTAGRYLPRAIRFRPFGLGFFGLVVRIFAVALFASLRVSRATVAAAVVLQVLGLRSQRTLRGPPR